MASKTRLRLIVSTTVAALLAACGGAGDGREVWEDPVTGQVVQLATIADCPGGYNVIGGTNGNDVLIGTAGNDCIVGLGGDDTITGDDGDDIIYGGNGNDTINAGGGNDFVNGEVGNDTINGGTGNDNINGDWGNDVIHGDDGNDTVSGANDSDQVFGDAGGDTVNGNAGTDICDGGDGNDNVAGGDGADTVRGGPGADNVNGGAGVDTVQGDDGDDLLFGGTEADTLEGGNGNDKLNGEDGNDHLWGDFINNATLTTGADTLHGNNGDDDLHGGDGDDVLFGDAGNDTLEGDNGDDRLVAGTGGTKTLSGGNGNDLAKGLSGSSTLNGDEDNDVLVVAGTANGGNGTDACTNGTSCELVEPPSFCTQTAGQCGSGQRCASEVGVCIYCQSDSECTTGKCVPTLGCSSTEQQCTNGVDDDGDGPIDCADSDCVQNPACQTGVVALGAGGVFHNCVATWDGASTRQVKCWGRALCGEIGSFPVGNQSSTPAVVAGLTSPLQVRGALTHTCALESDGTVKCWGSNSTGQLGNGTTGVNCTAANATPAAVPGLSGITQIAAGGNTTCAVGGGSLKCWGQSNWGQVGTGTGGNVPSPGTVMGGVTSVAVGVQHACALMNDGTVKCWGRNHQGQVGNGSSSTTTAVLVPATVVGLSGIVEVGAGRDFSCARRSNNTVACWGDNTFGQLGNGTVIRSLTAATVPGVNAVVSLGVGWSEVCGVRIGTNGMYCWGRNDDGEVGINSTTSPIKTAQLLSIFDATTVTLGGAYACYRKSNGTISCAGDGAFGQLGNGTADSHTFAPVPSVP